MSTITINNIEYDIDSLSTEAKNQLASLQFVDQQLARLEGEIAVYRTARIGYSNALKELLPDSKGKKPKH